MSRLVLVMMVSMAMVMVRRVGLTPRLSPVTAAGFTEGGEVATASKDRVLLGDIRALTQVLGGVVVVAVVVVVKFKFLIHKVVK